MLESIVIGVSNGAIYGLLAVGLVLVYKGSRVLNFAQGELGTMALYVAWVLIDGRGWPWLAGAAVAIASIALLGLAFELIVIRPMGDAPPSSLAVATIGLLFLLGSLELKIWGVTPKVLEGPVSGQGIEISSFFVTPAYLVALSSVVAIATLLAIFFRRSKFGLAVLGAAQDRSTARLMGIPLFRVSAFVWGTAGAIAAVAALTVEPAVGAFHPFFMTLLFLRGLAAALIGGLTSLPGAFVGGVAIGIFESFVRRQWLGIPGVSEAMLLLLILAVLLIRPQGLLARPA